MASYTMQLREYIESFSQYDDTLSWKDRIEIGRKKLFDFEYPIFDENYRKVWETNFIRKFYMREIGFETEGLFKFQLETWLNINMPYFNTLFESTLLKFDPLTNSKMDVSSNKKSDLNQKNTSTGTSSGDTFNRGIHSDTPENRLAITTEDGKGVIQYASDISEATGNNSMSSNEDSTNDVNTVEDFIQHREGKIGVQTYSKMLQEYRESLIRVENKMYDEMQELFMLVY